MLKALFAAAAFAAVLAAPAARADALPMPLELNEFQAELIGVWEQQGWSYPQGLGHAGQTGAIAFGNDDMTILTLVGVPMVGDLGTRATAGSWTAKRLDEKTVEVTLDQGGGRGTVLTLTFDGPDAFTMVNAEQSYLSPGKFVRVGRKIEPYKP